MKKFLAILLTVALAVSAGVFMVACKGKNDPAAEEFTVTFDLNYTNAPEATTQKVKSGETVVEPNAPSRTGYKFAGWFNGAERYDFDLPVTRDLTLKAHWNSSGSTVQKENLTFENNDGARYVFESGAAPTGVAIGTTVQFLVEKSPFYKGEMKVLANNEELTPSASGVYEVTVSTITTVTVQGLTADTEFLHGLGTETNPYKIATPAQWLMFATMINSESGNIGTRNFELTADIDFLGFNIPAVSFFQGVLSGNGHKLSNFAVTVTERYGDDEQVLYTTNAGLFARIANATVTDLYIDNASVTVSGNGVLTAGILAGDIVSSKVSGVDVSGDVKYGNEGNYYAFLGGLAGTARAIPEYKPLEISYCNSTVAVNSDYMGIAGGLIGRLSSEGVAIANVYNCTAEGNIAGGHYAGGLVGYQGSYTSVTNSFATGSVTAFVNYDRGQSVAGGIVGYFSNVEAVIANCFTVSDVDAYAPLPENTFGGDIYGLTDTDYYAELTADVNASLIFETYYAPLGKYGDHDLTTSAGITVLLGWNTDKWNFAEDGYPTAKHNARELSSPVDFTVNFEESVDVNGTSATSVTFTVADKFATISTLTDGEFGVGNGMNIAGGDKTSCGLYTADNAAVPAGFLVTDNTKRPGVNVHFSDSSDIAGDYYFTADSIEYVLKLKGENKGTISCGQRSYEFTYMVFENGKVRLAGLPTIVAPDPDVNVTVEDGVLSFAYSYVENGENKNVRFAAYKFSEVFGKWYSDSQIYVFNPDGTGKVGAGEFTYTEHDGTVTLSSGETLTVSVDKQTLAGDTLTLTRLDMFAGKYESDRYIGDYIVFDGKGRYETPGNNEIAEGDYTIDDGVLSFTYNGNTLTYVFDERGYLISNEAEYGLEGGMAGKWSNELRGYSLTLSGITRHGFGYAKDSDGKNFYYVIADKGFDFYVDNDFAFNAEIRENGAVVSINTGATFVDLRLYNELAGDWYFGNSTLTIGNAGVRLDKSQSVGYEYNNSSKEISFEVGEKTYVAAIMEENMLALWNHTDGPDKNNITVYAKYDGYYKGLTKIDGNITLDFNGMGELGRGSVTITENGNSRRTTYTVDENGNAVIAGFGTIEPYIDRNTTTGELIDTGYWIMGTGKDEDGDGKEDKELFGVNSPYLGQWAVQLLNGFCLDVMMIDDFGSGIGWLYGWEDEPVLVDLIPNDELDGLDVYEENADQKEFTVYQSEYGIRLLLGVNDLPMAQMDDVWGNWYPTSDEDKSMLSFDGVGLTSNYYRGSLSYYENIEIINNYNEFTEMYLYSYAYDENGERVNVIYALDGEYLMGYATFEIVEGADKLGTRLNELKAEGIAPNVYSKGNSYILIKLFHADKLTSLDSVSSENGGLYRFEITLKNDVYYGLYDLGIMYERAGANKEYVYRVEYATEDASLFILTVYDKGTNGEPGDAAFMAVVSTSDGETYTLKRIELTDTGSLPVDGSEVLKAV